MLGSVRGRGLVVAALAVGMIVAAASPGAAADPADPVEGPADHSLLSFVCQVLQQDHPDSPGDVVECAVDGAFFVIEEAIRYAQDTTCDAFGQDSERYVRPVGCVIEGVDERSCGAIVGEDRPEYYTTLDCVLHPVDRTVCEALVGEHNHRLSYTDCVRMFVFGE